MKRPERNEPATHVKSVTPRARGAFAASRSWMTTGWPATPVVPCALVARAFGVEVGCMEVRESQIGLACAGGGCRSGSHRQDAFSMLHGTRLVATFKVMNGAATNTGDPR